MRPAASASTDLVFPRQLQFYPAAQQQRLARTYKAAAHRQVRRYPAAPRFLLPSR